MEKIKTSILDCGFVVLLFSIGNQHDKKTTRQFIVFLLLIVSLIDTCETSVVIIKRFLFKEIVGVLAILLRLHQGPHGCCRGGHGVCIDCLCT